MNVLQVLVALVGLGIMVFMHELGHFLAAKAAGVGVETFALGWGPKLLGFSRGGTEYRLAWLPIGGYCKFKGDEGLKQALEQNLPEVPREPGSFYAVPAWKRIVVVAAGPVASLLSAFLIFTLMWWIGFGVFSTDNRIVLATDYTRADFTETPPATAAGLATGDRIVAIDGRPVRNFQDILELVSRSPDRELALTVERDGTTRSVSVTPAFEKSTGTGRIGVYAWQDPVVRVVAPGSAAALAGLAPGDRIVRAGTRVILQRVDLEAELTSQPATLSIGYERAGAVHDTVLVIEYVNGQANLGLQFADSEYRTPRLGLGGALARAGTETWDTVVLTIRGIGLLFRGVNLREAVAGPIGIIDLIGSTAASGFARSLGQGVVRVFQILAFLSVTLFLMNLLPLPALDGGQIVVALVEVVRRRAVRPRVVWRVQMIGFSFLVVLVLMLTFNDILLRIGR
jgi:regulator of sigma E protease